MTVAASANRSHPLSTTCVMGLAATSTRSNACGSFTGYALGYAPEGAPDYGLDRTSLAAPGRRYAELLHATARSDKEWPEANGIELVEAIGRNGLDLVLLWGNSAERKRAERIAARRAGVYVGELQPLDAVARQIASAAFVVGVDTGLLHIAAALGVPLVAILVRARDRLAAPANSEHTAVLGAPGGIPTVADVTRAISASRRDEVRLRTLDDRYIGRWRHEVVKKSEF